MTALPTSTAGRRRAPRNGGIDWDVERLLKIAGEERGMYGKVLRNAAAHYYTPASRQVEPHSSRFARLCDEWKAAGRLSPTARDRALHPAYQGIIGMGIEALPFLLEELRARPDHWFWALKAITGLDPVASADRGDLAAMTRAWLQLGRERGWTR